LIIKRKVLWKDNTIRMNLGDRLLPDSKAAANRAIGIERNVNANNASARSRAAEANPVAANKADDKAGCLELASGGRRLPPLVMPRYVEKHSSSVATLLL
jgi:hypothetical protein